jgi:hypothetical protein
MGMGYWLPQRDLRHACSPDDRFRFGRADCSFHFFAHVCHSGQFSVFLPGSRDLYDEFGRGRRRAHAYAASDANRNTDPNRDSDTNGDSDRDSDTGGYSNSNPDSNANANCRPDAHAYSHTQHFWKHLDAFARGNG